MIPYDGFIAWIENPSVGQIFVIKSIGQLDKYIIKIKLVKYKKKNGLHVV